MTHAGDVLEKLIGYLQQRKLLSDAVDAQTISTTLFHMTIGTSFNMLHQPLDERQSLLNPLIRYIGTLRVPT